MQNLSQMGPAGAIADSVKRAKKSADRFAGASASGPASGVAKSAKAGAAVGQGLSKQKQKLTAPDGTVYLWDGTQKDADRIQDVHEKRATGKAAFSGAKGSAAGSVSPNSTLTADFWKGLGGLSPEAQQDPNFLYSNPATQKIAFNVLGPRKDEPLKPGRDITEFGNIAQDLFSTMGVNAGGDNPFVKFLLGHLGGLVGGAVQTPATVAGGAMQVMDPASTTEERLKGGLEAAGTLAMGPAIGKLGKIVGPQVRKIGDIPAVREMLARSPIAQRLGGRGAGVVDEFGAPPTLSKMDEWAKRGEEIDAGYQERINQLEEMFPGDDEGAKALRRRKKSEIDKVYKGLVEKHQGSKPSEFTPKPPDQKIKENIEKGPNAGPQTRNTDPTPIDNLLRPPRTAPAAEPVAPQPRRTQATGARGAATQTATATATKVDEFGSPSFQTSDGAMSYLDDVTRAQIHGAPTSELKKMEAGLLSRELNPVEKETLIRIRKRLGSKAAPTPEQAAAAAARTEAINAGRAAKSNNPVLESATNSASPKPVAQIAERPDSRPTAYKSAEGYAVTDERMNPNDIGVKPGLQYKKSGIIDDANAVTAELKGASVYDHATAGPLTVWEDSAGKRWVMNGHHRRELAIRTGETDLPIKVFRESEGVDFKTARGLGALQNIRDSKGTAIDALAVIRDLGFDKAKLKSIGISTDSRVGRDAMGMMNLSDESLEFVHSGVLPEEVAGAIGASGLPPDRMAAAIRIARRSNVETRAQALILAEKAKTAPMVKPPVKPGDTADLFGEIADELALGEQAKIHEAVVRRLIQDKRLLEAANRIRPVGKTTIDKAAQTQEASVQHLATQVLATDEKTSRILLEEAIEYAKNPSPSRLKESADRVIEVALEAADRRAAELGVKPRATGPDTSPGVSGGKEGLQPQRAIEDIPITPNRPVKAQKPDQGGLISDAELDGQGSLLDDPPVMPTGNIGAPKSASGPARAPRRGKFGSGTSRGGTYIPTDEMIRLMGAAPRAARKSWDAMRQHLIAKGVHPDRLERTAKMDFDKWSGVGAKTTARGAVAGAQPKKDQPVGVGGKIIDGTQRFVDNVAGAARSTLATGDVSASMTQGGIAMLTDTKSWGKGAYQGLKALNKKQYDEVIKNVSKDPDFARVKASGVDLPGLAPQGESEVFFDTALNKIPGLGRIIKGSQQSYDATLTVIRANMVKDYIKLAEANGKKLDPKGLKVIGDAVNTLTGRGSGNLAKGLSQAKAGNALFAPSYWVSQWEAVSAKPIRDALNYAKTTGNYGPAKVMGRKYTRLISAGGGLLFGAKAALEPLGWKVETDPRSSQFGKAVKKVGGEVATVDIIPPQLSGPMKMIGQVVGGRKDSKTGKVNTSAFARAGAVGNLMENKLAPVPKVALNIRDAYFGEKKFGKSYDLSTAEGWKNLGLGQLPISAQQMKEIIESKTLTDEEKALMLGLSPFGRGANTYAQGK